LRIGITGSTGFVGKRMLAYDAHRYELIPLTIRDVDIPGISLAGLDAIVHLAGKAHQMEPIADEVYFQVNYELTRQLAIAAKEQGVPHFIYISSTKVYGDEAEQELNEYTACVPTDPYGKSKRDAELFLLGMQLPAFAVAILRPPVVYGPEVKGNIIRLLKLADTAYPLPFGEAGNLRSMVFVDNLVELINTIIDQKASGIFLAGDQKPLSTNQLISGMRQALGRPNRLVAIPLVFRKMVKKVRPALYARLFGSFLVNPADTNQRLKFVPPFTSVEGIGKMVAWYKDLH